MPDVIANDIWVASVGGKKLVIRCEVNDLTWYEVRTIVSKRLGVEPFSGELSIERNPAREPPAGAEVLEVRWKAFLVFADDADGHEFKVAVPRDFAQKIDTYLEAWDESYEVPKISITFSVENDGE